MLLCQAYFRKKGKTAVTTGRRFKLREKVGGEGGSDGDRNIYGTSAILAKIAHRLSARHSRVVRRATSPQA